MSMPAQMLYTHAHDEVMLGLWWSNNTQTNLQWLCAENPQSPSWFEARPCDHTVLFVSCDSCRSNHALMLAGSCLQRGKVSAPATKRACLFRAPATVSNKKKMLPCCCQDVNLPFPWKGPAAEEGQLVGGQLLGTATALSHWHLATIKESNPPLHEAHETHSLHAQASCTLDQVVAGFS